MNRFRAEERGATAVLLGVLLPVLLAISAIGVETLAIAGADREAQRAADAAALTAAAQRPLADTGAVGIGGRLGTLVSAVAPPSDPERSAEALACATAEQRLIAGPMSQAFGEDPPTCEDGRIDVEVTGELLDELEGLLTDLTSQVPGLDSQLDDPLQTVTTLLAEAGLPVDLHGLLPAVASPRVRVAIHDLEIASPMRGLVSLADRDGDVAASTDVARTAEARRRFKNVLLLPVADTCAATNLYGFVQEAIDGLQIPDNRLTPTVLDALQDVADQGLISADSLAHTLFDLLTLTEKVTLGLVDLTGTLLRPIVGSDLGPIVGELKKRSVAPGAPSAITTMLRNIDPASLGLDLVGDAQESVSGILLAGDPSTVVTPLQDTFGPLLGTLPGFSEDGCEINANAVVGPVTDEAWAALQEVRDALAALPAPLGPRLETIVDLLVADLRDLIDPAADGPRPEQIVNEARDADEEVLVVVVGSTAVPLLDFFPVPGGQLHAMIDTHTDVDGDLDLRGLVGDLGAFNNAATDARGIFRASLVR